MTQAVALILEALGLEDIQSSSKKNIHGEIIPASIDLLPGEDFRFVKDFPRYIVTTHGRIINILTGRVMKQVPHKTAAAATKYIVYDVCLRDREGKSKSFYVHQLVASAFCDKPEGIPESKLVVNHIDGNTSNNMASNLEWITRSDNSKIKLNTKWPNDVAKLREVRKNYKSNTNEYKYLSIKIYKLDKINKE